MLARSATYLESISGSLFADIDRDMVPAGDLDDEYLDQSIQLASDLDQTVNFKSFIIKIGFSVKESLP